MSRDFLTAAPIRRDSFGQRVLGQPVIIDADLIQKISHSVLTAPTPHVAIEVFVHHHGEYQVAIAPIISVEQRLIKLYEERQVVAKMVEELPQITKATNLAQHLHTVTKDHGNWFVELHTQAHALLDEYKKIIREGEERYHRPPPWADQIAPLMALIDEVLDPLMKLKTQDPSGELAAIADAFQKIKGHFWSDHYGDKFLGQHVKQIMLYKELLET